MNDSSEKRLLFINPNTTVEVTQRLQHFVQPLLPNSVQLDAVTARFGARYIACEAGHAVAAHAAVDAWATYLQTNKQAIHGVLIGCFGDPGLFALREAAACKVTGLAEASFIQAAALGEFAIVTGGERWKPMLMRLAQNLGFDKQLRCIEIVKPTGAQLLADPAMAMDCLGLACAKAAAHGVKAIIIGGAGLAGYAAQLQNQCAVPLIDSVQAGLEVILSDALPLPERKEHSFEAQWFEMPPAVQALQRS